MAAKQIGRFEVLRQLAQTDLGAVYKALDVATSRHVVVRTLRGESSPGGAALILPFLVASLRQAMELDSPNIARIFEVGESGEDFFVVTEYVEGTTIRSLLDRRQTSVWDIIDIARQCCTAIDHARSRHVAHWNLSPVNLMQEWDGTVKVMDYGLVVDPVERARTSGNCDHLRYLAPEQLAGEMPTALSNIFSLGAILYELASGRKAFPGDHLAALLETILEATPEPVHQVKPAIQPALSNVISRALAKSPADRFPSGADMIAALDVSLKPEPMPPIVPPPPPGPPPAEVPKVPAAIPAEQKQSSTATAPAAPQVTTQAPAITAATAPAADRSAVNPEAAPPAPPAPVETVPPPVSAPAPAPDLSAGPSATPPQEFIIVHSRFSPVTAPPVAAIPRLPKPRSPKPLTTKRPAAFPKLNRVWLYVLAAVFLLALGIFVGRALSSAKNTASPAAQPETGQTGPVAPPPDVASAGVDILPKPQPRAKKQPAPPPVAAPVVTTGDLFIDSSPQGAAIQIDGGGGPSFLTPYTAAGLEAGAHMITLAKPGYAVESRAIELVAGTKASLAVSLTELKATLVVGSDPAGATVFLDGANTGKLTPFEVALHRGSHTVLLRKPGFFDEERTLELSPGQSSRFSTRLLPMGNADGVRSVGKFKRLFGGDVPRVGAKVKVTTNPKGAQIRLNHLTLEKVTPTEFMLPPGIYEITLTLPGYKPVQKRVSLVDGSDSLINEALSPAN